MVYVSRFTQDKTYQKNPDTFLNNYDPDDKIFNQQGYKPYNNYNTNATPTTTVYKQVNDDLYGDVEI